jgi:outer membrane protein TolC
LAAEAAALFILFFFMSGGAFISTAVADEIAPGTDSPAAQVEAKPPDVSPVLSPSTAPLYLSYEEALNIALKDNVDLKAGREQVGSFEERSKQAMGPNEPVFSYTRADAVGSPFTGAAAQTEYGINWTLGFPGKALSQSASVRHQAESALEQTKLQEIAMMTSLSNIYVAFAINADFYNFLLDEQKSDAALIKLIEKRFAASQASKVDLLNAQVATQQIAQAILQNRNDYDVLLTQLRQLIRRPTDKSIFPNVPKAITIPNLTKDYDELVAIMLRNSHAVGAAQKQFESSDSLVTNAALQALPDLQLSAAYNRWLPSSTPNPGSVSDVTIGIGIAVPIFFVFNELPGINAAQHDRAAAELQLTSQKLQATAALQTAFVSLKATLKDLDASQHLVVPAAKASFDLTMLTYGMGKADYLMLFQTRKALHDAERDMLNKQQNAAQFYNQVIAQLGCDIERTEGPYVCK